MEIEGDGDVLTEEELYAQCVMLLFGGHETTRNLIGNGLYTLLRHPQQNSELREHPELIRSAVEELLRYESPVQYTGRMVLEDFEFCGVRACRGQEIIFMLGAANRDASEFNDPDRLDLNSNLLFVQEFGSMPTSLSRCARPYDCHASMGIQRLCDGEISPVFAGDQTRSEMNRLSDIARLHGSL